ncbi:MAG TPA: AraC family transcriptional regulator [Chryseosolibacter sp.]
MNPTKIDYQDILSMARPVAGTSADCEHWTASSERWGSYQEKVFHHDHFQVREIIAGFKTECILSVRDADLAECVNIILPLSGSVSCSYLSLGLKFELGSKRHHQLYIPASAFEWRMSQKVRLFHLQVDRAYFISLLSHGESWSAALRGKLIRKEVVYRGEGVACPPMQHILHDLLHAQVSGYLKKMFIEAKVLSFIALHLNHMKDVPRAAQYTLKKNDKAILATIHRDLADRFKEEHSLRQLSKVYGLNECALKKGFKSLYGTTIFNYLSELKMDHARHLLLEEGKLIREVSREVGYKNPHHFSAAFKRKFGMNPVLLRQ